MTAKHLFQAAREHVTHWAVGGACLVLTGFAPEEWTARLVHWLGITEHLQAAWPASIDPRMAVVTLGTAIIVGDLLLRRRHHETAPVSAAPVPLVDSPPVQKTLRSTTSGAAPRLSIVVLPFANLSGDPEQEYFADGITEDLTTDLSRLSGSFVIAAHTALAYKGKAVDIKEIGRQLGIRYALEGSVRRIGNQMRVNAQLADAESGAHLWADRFDGDLSDMGQLQDEVTARLARALNVEIVAAETRRSENERPDHPDAVDLVLRGQDELNKAVEPKTLSRARRFFEEALQLDGGNVEALCGLAEAVSLGVLNRVAGFPEADTELAYETAIRVVSLKPFYARAHYAVGTALRARKGHEDAQAAFEKAIACDRNYAAAYAMLGHTRHYLGRSEDTIDLVQHAIRLSPLDPQLGTWLAIICFALLSQERDDEALEWARKAVNASPRHFAVYQVIASIQALRGNLAEARAALARYGTLQPGTTISQLRQRNQSDNPIFLARRERFLEGLRKAGMPEH